MKDNKLNHNSAFLQPPISISTNNNHRPQLNSFRSRYLSQKPAVFSCENKLKNTYSGHFGSFTRDNYGIKKKKKISLERIKEQH